MFDTFHAIIFEGQVKCFDSRNVAENRFWLEIATWDHSKWFILQSITKWQVVAYRHIILLALPLKFLKKWISKLPKIAVVDKPTEISCPALRNPCRYLHDTLISKKTSHWSKFLTTLEWVYLYSNFCSELQKTHLFCNSVRVGRSRTSMFNHFGTNRMRICDFLLVCHCDHGPNLHHFWNTVTYWLNIAYFPNPSLIWCPAHYVPFGISWWS